MRCAGAAGNPASRVAAEDLPEDGAGCARHGQRFGERPQCVRGLRRCRVGQCDEGPEHLYDGRQPVGLQPVEEVFGLADGVLGGGAERGVQVQPVQRGVDGRGGELGRPLQDDVGDEGQGRVTDCVEEPVGDRHLVSRGRFRTGSRAAQRPADLDRGRGSERNHQPQQRYDLLRRLGRQQPQGLLEGSVGDRPEDPRHVGQIHIDKTREPGAPDVRVPVVERDGESGPTIVGSGRDHAADDHRAGPSADREVRLGPDPRADLHLAQERPGRDQRTGRQQLVGADRVEQRLPGHRQIAPDLGPGLGGGAGLGPHPVDAHLSRQRRAGGHPQAGVDRGRDRGVLRVGADRGVEVRLQLGLRLGAQAQPPPRIETRHGVGLGPRDEAPRDRPVPERNQVGVFLDHRVTPFRVGHRFCGSRRRCRAGTQHAIAALPH